MKAIQTRYLSPTNHRGSRIRAFAEGGCQIYADWSYDLSIESNHKKAALLLMNKYSWDQHSKISGSGVLPCGDYVFCLEGRRLGE